MVGVTKLAINGQTYTIKDSTETINFNINV